VWISGAGCSGAGCSFALGFGQLTIFHIKQQAPSLQLRTEVQFQSQNEKTASIFASLCSGALAGTEHADLRSGTDIGAIKLRAAQ
jgi:hypothetical protein